VVNGVICACADAANVANQITESSLIDLRPEERESFTVCTSRYAAFLYNQVVPSPWVQDLEGRFFLKTSPDSRGSRPTKTC